MASELSLLLQDLKKSYDLQELTDILQKGKRPMPIGAIRTWSNGVTAIKHSDGWVVVGGKHHGKLMGKFKEEAKHKLVADLARMKQEKEDKTSVQTPKKEEKPKKEKHKETTFKTKKVSLVDIDKELNQKTNMVSFAHFSRAGSKELREKLYKTTNQANLVVNEMGIKFKTPVEFSSANLKKGRGKWAGQYFPGMQPQIRIYLDQKNMGNTVMHEIGHAVDFAMQETGKYPRGRAGDVVKRFADDSSDELQNVYEEILETVAKSEYYADPRHKLRFRRYLAQPTEMFARAFEVYSLTKAEKLIKDGKLSQDFIENALPAVFRSSTAENPIAKVIDKLDEKAKISKKLAKQVNRTSISVTSRIYAENPELASKVKTGDKDAMDKIRDLIKDAPVLKNIREKFDQANKEYTNLWNEYKEMKDKKSPNAALTKPISKDKQEEYKKKLEPLMDKLFSMDKIRKAIQQLNEDLQKAIIHSELSGIDINTAEHSIDDLASRNNDWVDALKHALDNCAIGDVPQDIPLENNYLLTAMQVDDGLYDGQIRNMDETSGEKGQVVAQIVKMTLPQMVQALSAKGFITNQNQKQKQKEHLELLCQLRREASHQNIEFETQRIRQLLEGMVRRQAIDDLLKVLAHKDVDK